ncbi:MAG: hypothetical protein ACXVLQ_16345 [Bacteriovorax sp.]
MRKGDKFEKDFSLEIHQIQRPVLISSLLLRSINAGQVDVAGLTRKKSEWLLHLYEVKTGHGPAGEQWRRLLRAQDYLSKVLEMGVKLEVKFCQKDDP